MTRSLPYRYIPGTPGQIDPGATQPFGFNLAIPSSAESANNYQDSAGNQSWYFDTDLANGAISASTGLPTSGITKLTIQLRGGEKYANGDYVVTWTGGASIESQSSPIQFTAAGPGDSVTLDAVGVITSITITPVGGVTGTYTASSAARFARGNCLRVMDPWRINEDGGSSAAAYDPANPYVRIRTIPGANTFYHQALSATRLGAIATTYGKDLWLCFHHRATDQNVIDAVNDVEATGFTGVLYIEHSNEVWNSSWPQYGYALTQISGYGGPGDPQNVQAWHADRTHAIGGVAKGQYGNCNVVWGSQMATPNFIQNSLQWAQSSLTNIDSAAIAPYFGRFAQGQVLANETAGTVTGRSIATIVADAEVDFNDRVKGLISTWNSESITRGWDLLGYEMGCSLEHNDSGAQAHLTAASQSTEMGATYGRYLDWWDANVGNLGLLYRDVGSDEFGHLQYELSSASPRWQAFLDRVV